MLKIFIEKLKCFKSVVKTNHQIRKGRGEVGNGIMEGNAVLYQWQAYFYPTWYHAYFWCCVRTTVTVYKVGYSQQTRLRFKYAVNLVNIL